MKSPPYETGKTNSEIEASEIRIKFFNSLHNVTYSYNRAAKSYSRVNGGVRSEAQPYNVLILEAPINEIGAYGRLDISMVGSGKAMLFRSGSLQEGRWTRGSINEPFEFKDTSGKYLKFMNGQTWMTVLPTLERVRYE